MNAKVLTIVIVFVTNIRLCQSRRYDKYYMFKTVPTEKHHLKFLMDMQSNNYMNLVFWKRPSKLYEPVQFIVPPRYIGACRERMKHFGMEIVEISKNVQDLFDAQKSARRYTKQNSDTYSWSEYHNLEDINQWLTDISKKHSKIAELIRIGKTFENRDLYAVSINRGKPKGTVIVEAGLHGNELVATEFVTYLIKNLLEPQDKNDRRLIDVGKKFLWYLIPVANPDGYEFSYEHDRLWRKNRRIISNVTRGVDLNRNFNYSFGRFSSSNDPADDTYCGPRPFSEPETLLLAKFIADRSKDLIYYFSFHSYGQKIIIPYGDKILHVENYEDCENYGKQALIKIFKKSGLKYGIGNSYDTMGQKISGDSASWVKHVFHVPFVYTFLLRDAGKYGYGLPPSEILPTCEETLTAVLEIMTTHVKRLRADIFSLSGAGGLSYFGLVTTVILFWLAK